MIMYLLKLADKVCSYFCTCTGVGSSICAATLVNDLNLMFRRVSGLLYKLM